MSQLRSIAAGKLPRAGAEGRKGRESRSLEDLLFWIDCFGAPVLVMEKHTLTIRHANASAQAFFLREKAHFGRCTIRDLLGNEAEQMLAQVWSVAAIGTIGEPFIIRGVVNGQERMLTVRVSEVLVEEEALRLFTFTEAPAQDSAARGDWQDNIMEILNWFPFAFEIADNNDFIQFTNAHWRRLLGYEQHQLENVEDWWRLAYPDPDYREFAKTKWEAEISAARRENREMTPFDLDVATASGEFRTIQFHHRTIGKFNVNLFLDITQERAYERELKLLAGTDALTGVMNRRRFFEEAAPFFEKANAAPIAVLMLDIDHFKAINDAHGHGSGDLVLQEFTRRCAGILGGDDRLARLGGEEFVILLPEMTFETATGIAECLRSIVENRPFQTPAACFPVTTSVGGTCRLATDTIDTTVLRADRALYEAKRQGRNRVVML